MYVIDKSTFEKPWQRVRSAYARHRKSAERKKKKEQKKERKSG